MTTKSPKVTVLMGTYNRPDYLRDAITSVVNQSMEDWELLVMNDGGVNVDYVVNEFQDGRIRYFNDEVNRGLAARLNFGLKQARGEYIAYLGDDDMYYSHHLEVLSSALDETPDIGAAYSDLYAVHFVKDETNGKRYPTHKYISIARNYNRDFMFYFNQTLHVSLMHRKDIALKMGGYDESITVLIDWNLTGKLSFYTDFKYIPKLTGEYYVQYLAKSDRISDLERKDNERYKHNLRKIKADLPPEPWPKVDRIAVVFPVDEWSESVTEIITGLIDSISYPVKFIIVNNDTGKDESECRKALGIIGELKSIFIHTPPEPLSELEAYRFGAEKAPADYVYLPSKEVNPKFKVRLIIAREYLKGKKARVYRHHFGRKQLPVRYSKKKKFEGIKWDIEQEKESSFDMLIKKERFLQLTHPAKGKMMVDVAIVPPTPKKFECDLLITDALRQHVSGNNEQAFQLLQKAGSVNRGDIKDQFLMDRYFKVYSILGKCEELEAKCRALIEQGYGADNWIRLGRILQEKEKFTEAVKAYRQGIKEIGLKETDLESTAFPIIFTDDFDSFTAFMGLGECLLKTGDFAESARMFRRAAKLKANSHRPFLGFGKLFLESNDLDRAEEALLTAIKRNGKDPAAHHLLEILWERREHTGQEHLRNSV